MVKIEKEEILKILRMALENKVIGFKDLVPTINDYRLSDNYICEDIDCLSGIDENPEEEVAKCKVCKRLFHDEDCVVVSDDKESRHCFRCWNALSNEIKQKISKDTQLHISVGEEKN